MMPRVLAAEKGDRARVFALVLGPVRSRVVTDEPDWVSADEIGAVTVAPSGRRHPAEPCGRAPRQHLARDVLDDRLG